MRNSFGFPYLPKMYQQKDPQEGFGFIVAVIIFAILATLIYANVARAEVVDLDTIRQIESSGNPLAVSKTGACGLYQIMPCVLQEYNQFNKTNYSRLDLFNPKTNEKIANWYLNKRIPQMLRHYGKEVNTNNCIIAYNAGIRAVVKGYLPKETKNYLNKYARLARTK